jgi:hypothetical protein
MGVGRRGTGFSELALAFWEVEFADKARMWTRLFFFWCWVE